ncbi:MAG: sulfatase-like hydrolase/transferase [Thermoguttaceae bacterium]
MLRTALWCFVLAIIAAWTLPARAADEPGSTIVHDAEYYILAEQHRKQWDAEDRRIDARLDAVRKKHGRPPNIIHIMWDDTAFGDVGIPAISQIRGFKTPNIDRMAREGIMFTRMYTEPSCTPSRAACMTGRHPVRFGMGQVGWPLEYGGLRGEEVTIAEVLSKSGYATAFYAKWHLGDIEQSYPHNQGFDETLFTPYNQVAGLWNPQGDAIFAAMHIAPEIAPRDPYLVDKVGAIPGPGWVMTIEGRKGEQGREWGDRSAATYEKIDPECEGRVLDFVRRNAKAKKPFYVAYWPNLLSLFPPPKKTTVNKGSLAEGLTKLDAYIGQLMDELKALGIAENTLLVIMADNGPMVHNPPPSFGMTDTIFRGGKGDYTEGGVRVPAFAWWPGVIEPGQLVGDIIHQTDLYTTFARLGGATQYIPTDRVIDGLDQTALFLNGDTHGRRDYVFIYTGDILAATVKGRLKRAWVGVEGSESGVGAAFYDLYLDPREMNPLLVPLIHTSSQFGRMKSRHELWKQEYPDQRRARGIPFTGLSNARPETKAFVEQVKELKDALPFDPLEYIEVEVPAPDPDFGL